MKTRHWLVLLAAATASIATAEETTTRLRLRAEPAHFSPNGDGMQDLTFFYPVLRADEDITRWRLDVRRANGRRVSRITGAGFTALIKWDGADRKGRPVPDGRYEAALTVWGRSFRETSDPVTVFCDTQPPRADLSVSTPVLTGAMAFKDALVFNAGYRDASPPERWQFQVLDETGRTVHLEWSTETLRPIQWDGRDKATGALVPQGTYRCAFQAWDAAANGSEPVFLDVRVDVSPRDMLENRIERVDVFETPIGLIVQLDAANLFRPGSGKPEVRDEAADVLDEVAILINAYPDVPVRLDGYSRRDRSSSADRDRGSFMAWAVYSHLVKKGNVRASRLAVRGRGRSAMFDRRAVDLPVLKNGVEVILEGDRDWN